MINRIEDGVSINGLIAKEANGSLDARTKLKRFLPDLTKSDANLVKFFIDYDKNYPSSLLTDVVNLLEPNWEESRRKVKERLSCQQVDITEILGPFNDKEKNIIVQNILAYQMTDGCTVGCSFCGFESKRGVEKAFSYDSLKEFWQKYGPNVIQKSEVNLYYRSDPFDWIDPDGKLTYTSLTELFNNNVKNGDKIFTATTVPKGSELSIIGFFLFLVSSKSKKTGRNKDGMIEWKISDFDGFRFSRTKDNKKRIANILQILKDFNVFESFVKENIDIIDRGEIGENDGAFAGKVKKIGNLIKHSDRIEDGIDMLGLSGIDGLVISPLGITSESTEAATLKNPQGLRITQLLPGKLEIPEIVKNSDYECIYNKSREIIPLLPKHRYKVYENGKFLEIKAVESVRRDALAFRLALDNLEHIEKVRFSDKIKKAIGNNSALVHELIGDIEKEFVSKFNERKKSCISIFSEEQDKQAVRIATKLITKIDDWLAHMNEKMGISKSGTLL